MRCVAFIIFLLLSSISYAQYLSGSWQNHLQSHIAEFQSCSSNDDRSVRCFQEIGEALKSLYKINDFYSKDKSRYMTVSEINDYLESNTQWKLMGKGYDQTVLEQAQNLANKKRAVIAIYLNEERLGQLAYILPGDMTTSGSWGLKVPNSGAFNASAPEKSYTGKGLSYSFPRRLITKVQIYTREL